MKTRIVILCSVLSFTLSTEQPLKAYAFFSRIKSLTTTFATKTKNYCQRYSRKVIVGASLFGGVLGARLDAIGRLGVKSSIWSINKKLTAR